MIDLQELGITQEELQNRVIDRICERALLARGVDADGEDTWGSSKLAQVLNQKIKERVEETINAIAAVHVLPKVTEIIENFCLTRTNEWGEKLKHAPPVTFTEYLVDRANHWISEKVNYEGKSKDESQGYSWSAATTRVAYMIHNHLRFEIERALKKVFADANAILVGGLEAACKIKLQEIAKSLTVKAEMSGRG